MKGILRVKKTSPCVDGSDITSDGHEPYLTNCG